MKYVVTLCLLTIMVGLIYWRLRPYIAIARRVFGVMQDVHRINGQRYSARQTTQTTRTVNRDKASAEKLVRCTTCGTWLPESQAVKLRSSNSTYCSHACLERAADSSSQRRFVNRE